MMNANELADELNTLDRDDWYQWMTEAATMLRQQQAEIEALKAGKIRAYDNGVEDGRKPNTNPVKELTDEEILEIADANEWHKDEFAIKFARAILLL